MLRVPDLVRHAIERAADAAADRHPSVLHRIPREAGARRERVLAAAPQPAFEIVVTLDDVRALQPRAQIAAAAHDDVGHVAGRVVDVQERFVAHADVHAQVRLDLPVFLHERRDRLRAMEAREPRDGRAGRRIDPQVRLRARAVGREVEHVVEVVGRPVVGARRIVVRVFARVGAADLHAVRAARPGDDVAPLEAVLHELVRAESLLIAGDAAHRDAGHFGIRIGQLAPRPHPRERRFVHHASARGSSCSSS